MIILPRPPVPSAPAQARPSATAPVANQARAPSAVFRAFAPASGTASPDLGSASNSTAVGADAATHRAAEVSARKAQARVRRNTKRAGATDPSATGPMSAARGDDSLDKMERSFAFAW